MTSVMASIEERLALLEPEKMELMDESAQHVGHAGAQSGGGHFRLTIVSHRFSGKDRLARHRMVYGALAPLMTRDIHALAIYAYAPGEL